MSIRPAGEIRFGDTETVTAVNAADLDGNGLSDLVVGLSTTGLDDYGRTRPAFSTLFLFEQSGKSWKYLWKSSPMNKAGPKNEPVGDRISEILPSMDTNDGELHVRAESGDYLLRFEEGHYLMENDPSPVSAPVVGRDLAEYFRFPVSQPFFFMKKERQYLFLVRDGVRLEIYRFKPEADPSFLRAGSLKTGPVSAFGVFRNARDGRDLLCVGLEDGSLRFYQLGGM